MGLTEVLTASILEDGTVSDNNPSGSGSTACIVESLRLKYLNNTMSFAYVTHNKNILWVNFHELYSIREIRENFPLKNMVCMNVCKQDTTVGLNLFLFYYVCINM